MDTIVLLMTLGAVICMAFHSVVQKQLINSKRFSTKEILIFQHLMSVPFFVLMIPVFYFWVGEPLEPSSIKLYTFGVVGITVANLIIQFVNVKARENADLSLVAPVQAITPGLVAVTAIVLGEFPTQQTMIGIALIMVGTYIHSLENAASWRDWVRPFALLFLPSNFKQLDAATQQQLLKNRFALRLSYLSATMGTVGLISEGLTARNGSIGIGFAIQGVCLSLCYLAFVPQGNIQGDFKSRVGPFLPKALMLGLLWATFITLFALSFRLAPVASVGSLKRMSIVVIALLSIYVLKEAKAKRRLWPTMVITAGAIFIASDGVMGKVVDIVNEALK